MRIGDEFKAPLFGEWIDPDFTMPPEGVVVLGIGWTQEGYPVVQFVRFVGEDGDGDATWEQAFTGEDHIAPWLWSECRFVHSVGNIVEEDSFDPELN